MRLFRVVNGATQPAERGPLSIKYISPSALETFLDCPRKWAWVKIDRLPKPENKAAALGTETHAHHEAYLKHGKPYDLTQYSGRLAQCTQHLLPAPGSIPYEVEKERTIEIGGTIVQQPQFGGFSQIRIAGMVFGGKQDLRWGEIRPEGRVAIVHDHKTTGSLNWVKDTKEKLLAHPQAPIYALIGMQDFQTELAELRWTYALKDDRPKPFKSWHMVTDQEAYDAVSKFLEPASHMHLAVDLANKRGLRTLNLPFNPGACDKYGGCPFKSKCNLTRKDVLDMVQSPNFGDFIKGLQTMNPQVAQAVPNVPAQQAPAGLPFTPAQPAQAPVQLPPFQPQVQAAPALPFTVAQQAPVAPAVQHYGGQVNPPEAALPPPPPPAETPVAAPAEKAKRTRRTKAQIEADNAAKAAGQTFPNPDPRNISTAPILEETQDEPDTSAKDTYVKYLVFMASEVLGTGTVSPEQAAVIAATTYQTIEQIAAAKFPG